MKKNETIILLAVVVFIVIVGVGIYSVVMPLTHEEEHGEEKNDGFELLLKSAEFIKGKTKYQFTTKERIGDVEKTFFITQDGEMAYVKETLLGISREVFYTENGSILCFDFLRERYCDIANETKEMIIVEGFRTALLSDKRAEKEKKKFEVLERAGGLEVHSLKESESNGKKCTLINLKIEYGKLSFSDLGEIGLSPTDVAVSLIPYYNITYCIGKDGEVLSKQISYVYNGQEIEESFTIVDSNYESASIPALPENFTDLSKSFQLHYDIFNEYFNCLQSDEKDRCITSTAVKHLIPEMCEYANNKTKCYTAYVSFTLDPMVCEKFDLPMKDDCMYIVASEKKNETICRLIQNSSLAQECLSVSSRNEIEQNKTE